jgi:DNA-binding response OmpR family regulator
MMKTCVSWLPSVCKPKVIRLEADNGEDAETMILAEQPDIVLLDWMLPGKPGSEVCGKYPRKRF